MRFSGQLYNPGSPWKMADKIECVCVCVYVCVTITRVLAAENGPLRYCYWCVVC